MKRRELVQYGVVAVVLVAVVLAAWQGSGPFQAAPPALRRDEQEPSLWFFLLSDRLTLGFFRLGLIALAVYAIVSIPALIAGGRWVKGFGTSGLSVDDAQKVEDTEKAVATITKERDEWRAIAKRLLGLP